MVAKTMSNESDSPLEFPAIVDLYHVEELLPQLLEEETLPTPIDVSQVEKMTTAGIQLLLSMIATAQKIDAPLSMNVSSNEAITSAAQTLGLNPSECLDLENTT